MKTKIQVHPIALPAGTLAGKRSFQVTLEASYKNVRGFYIIRNTGAAYLKVGLIEPSGSSAVEPTNIKHFLVNENVKITDRFFKDAPFDAAGKKAQITVENFATLGAEENLDVLFLLDNEAR